MDQIQIDNEANMQASNSFQNSEASSSLLVRELFLDSSKSEQTLRRRSEIEGFIRQYCSSCKRMLRNHPAVRFNERVTCVGCFCKQLPQQTEYKVDSKIFAPSESLTFQPFQELVLLSCMEIKGFGNWEEIRVSMAQYGCNFTAQQIEHHYLENILPKSQTDALTQEEKISDLKCVETNIFSMRSSFSSKTSFYRGLESGRDITRKPLEQGILGFNYHRNEFEVEYDYHAEELISHLQFREDDSPQQTEMKFKLLGQYNSRLEKRYQVRSFVLEHKLLNEGYQREKEGMSDIEKSAENELKCLARFSTIEKHSDLTKKIVFSKQIQSLIEGIRRFRRSTSGSFRDLPNFIDEMEKPRKRLHVDPAQNIKSTEEVMRDKFGLTKEDLEQIMSSVPNNGAKIRCKGVCAYRLDSRFT